MISEQLKIIVDCKLNIHAHKDEKLVKLQAFILMAFEQKVHNEARSSNTKRHILVAFTNKNS